MAAIFISHSSHDKSFARDLARDLRALGHDVWLDEWVIHVGECIASKIEAGLDAADYVVLILTQRSVQSGWVEREWRTKYWQEVEDGQIRVLPALFEDCDIPGLLRTKLYAD